VELVFLRYLSLIALDVVYGVFVCQIRPNRRAVCRQIKEGGPGTSDKTSRAETGHEGMVGR
jgi:hypothetical protein